MRSARPGDDGTNLGDAIAWSLDALRAASPPKKVLILLSDGRNEPAVPHPLDPEAAAHLARDLGVTLHTIAVGQGEGLVRRAEPVTGLDLVTEVGSPTSPCSSEWPRSAAAGRSSPPTRVAWTRCFRRSTPWKKARFAARSAPVYHERFAPWVGLAAALLVLDRLLAAGRLRRLP